MRKRYLILVGAIFIIGAFSPPALAEPAMILYIEEAEYVGTSDDSWLSESWVTADSSFTLTIDTWRPLSGPGSTTIYEDVNLVASVPANEGGLGDIWVDGTLLTSYQYGTPSADGWKMPPHGIFPTDYCLFLVGDIDPGVDSGRVDLAIEWGGFSMVHFDVYGTSTNPGGIVNNPFSHDATAVGEPISLLLVGTGLLGMAGFARARFNRKRGIEK